MFPQTPEATHTQQQPTLSQCRADDEKSSSDSSELKWATGSVSSTFAASLTFSPAASPSLHTRFWFDLCQRDLTQMWTEAEGEDQISPAMHRVDVRSGGVGASSSSSSTVSGSRHISSSQVTGSPLHSVITSLPCSCFLLWAETTWQRRLLLIQLRPSLHLPAVSHLHADRSSMFLLHHPASPSLLLPPHGLLWSLLLQRFNWGSFHLLTTALLLRCEDIISFLQIISHWWCSLQTVTDVYVLSKVPKQEVLRDPIGRINVR